MGSIVGAATFPLAVWLVQKGPLPVLLASVAGGAFIIYKHSNNIEADPGGHRESVLFWSSQVKRLAIIGGGSWGTALAIVLSPRFQHIRLWVYEQDLAARMAETHENDIYLPGSNLPRHVEVTSELGHALEGAEIVLSVMPSHLVRLLYQQMLPFLNESMLFVSATKGLENGSLLRVSEVIREILEIGFRSANCGDLRTHLRP